MTKTLKLSLGALFLLSLGCTMSNGDVKEVSMTSPQTVQSSQQKNLNTFKKYVEDDGTIVVPADYRNWVHLGTWSLASNDDKGASGIHVVYTQPSVVEHYNKIGQFPDGAVLVKELLGTQTESLSTGIASSAKEISGYFVMVKDDKGRFPENPLWGEGWGWAYFEVTDLMKTTSTNYRSDCLGCHLPVKESDWVFVQGYPRLQ